MIPAVVVDVGNTRIKWGRCSAASVVEQVSLPADERTSWQQQLETWQLPSPSAWALAGVHPERLAGLEEWLTRRGDSVRILRTWRNLGLEVLLIQPETVGMDRLLNAVAARSHGPGPAIMIDAGSAVTVDWLDENGSFRGGAIFPGLRLMAQVLHEHTALLPLIETPREQPPMPGQSTALAMAAGIFWSVAGGIRALVTQLADQNHRQPRIFLTGGDGPLLKTALDDNVIHWPAMTLEGIRCAAQGSGV